MRFLDFLMFPKVKILTRIDLTLKTDKNMVSDRFFKELLNDFLLIIKIQGYYLFFKSQFDNFQMFNPVNFSADYKTC